MTTILQLAPLLEVKTPLGDGFALLVIDYGIHLNTCWVVALKADGRIKHFDSNDVLAERNCTYKINDGRTNT